MPSHVHSHSVRWVEDFDVNDTDEEINLMIELKSSIWEEGLEKGYILRYDSNLLLYTTYTNKNSILLVIKNWNLLNLI